MNVAEHTDMKISIKRLLSIKNTKIFEARYNPFNDRQGVETNYSP
jgi:hypothetical protein